MRAKGRWMLRRRTAERLTCAPEGPARPHSDVDSRAAGRGEPQRPPLKGRAPRPTCGTACTRGHDVPRSRQRVWRWPGAPVLSGLLAPAGRSGTGMGRLAAAVTRLTTAVATAWPAAG